VVLVLVFAGAALAASRIDVRPGRAAAEGDAHGAAAMAPQPLRGLAVSQQGMSLELARRTAPAGRRTELAFRIAGHRAPLR
jgi:hypothetical protein